MVGYAMAALPTGLSPTGSFRPRGPLFSAGDATNTQGTAKAPGTATPLRSRLTAAHLPPPQVLARNPALVNSVRKGESAFFRPGGAISSDAWLHLIANSGTKPGGEIPSRGSKELATATIAKAIASYGQAGALAGMQPPTAAVPLSTEVPLPQMPPVFGR